MLGALADGVFKKMCKHMANMPTLVTWTTPNGQIDHPHWPDGPSP